MARVVRVKVPQRSGTTSAGEQHSPIRGRNIFMNVNTSFETDILFFRCNFSLPTHRQRRRFVVFSRCRHLVEFHNTTQLAIDSFLTLNDEPARLWIVPRRSMENVVIRHCHDVRLTKARFWFFDAIAEHNIIDTLIILLVIIVTLSFITIVNNIIVNCK